MPTYPVEVAGLPAEGPATLPATKLALSIPAEDTRDDDRITAMVEAVNAQVRCWPVAGRALNSTPAVWPADVVQGAAMLAARLYKRRNSPAGVEVMGQLGAAYVMRNDPDIAMLLGVGSWSRPELG